MPGKFGGERHAGRLHDDKRPGRRPVLSVPPLQAAQRFVASRTDRDSCLSGNMLSGDNKANSDSLAAKRGPYRPLRPAKPHVARRAFAPDVTPAAGRPSPPDGGVGASCGPWLGRSHGWHLRPLSRNFVRAGQTCPELSQGPLPGLERGSIRLHGAGARSGMWASAVLGPRPCQCGDRADLGVSRRTFSGGRFAVPIRCHGPASTSPPAECGDRSWSRSSRGNGLGLERSSAWVLGSRGQLGSAGLGRDNEDLYVNAATGNLLVHGSDEILAGRFVGAQIGHSYNSLGAMTDDNGDNWRPDVSRKVVGTNGNATIIRTDWDGSEEVFNWDGAAGCYVFKDGKGADDTLSFASNVWTWIDGDTGMVELYDNRTVVG